MTRPALPLRFLPAAAVALAAGWAAADEVTVPTASGGTWTMVVAPQGTAYEPPVVRVAIQDGVPEPLDMPSPGDEPEPAEDAAGGPAEDADEAADAPMPQEERLPQEPPPAPESYFEVPSAPIEAPAYDAGPATGMTITPAGKGGSAASDYARVYASIPFNRAEYVANPSYRHDAAMELLTGTPRPGGGRTGRTLALPRPSVYRPFLPSSSEFAETPFPYFGGAGFTGVGYGGIGNGGYSYTGPSALGLGNAGINTGLDKQFGVIGAGAFGGFGFGGFPSGLGFNGRGFGIGRAIGGGFGRSGFGLGFGRGVRGFGRPGAGGVSKTPVVAPAPMPGH